MYLSEIQNKEIVKVDDGKKIGNIIDIEILDDGKVNKIILEKSKNFLKMNSGNEFSILWRDIDKIGEDVILVNIK